MSTIKKIDEIIHPDFKGVDAKNSESVSYKKFIVCDKKHAKYPTKYNKIRKNKNKIASFTAGNTFNVTAYL